MSIHTSRPGAAGEPVTRSGRVAVDGGRHEVAYRVFGTGARTMLALHGGPGMGSRYLDRLAEVADDERQVVLYDELGAGESDRPEDHAAYSLERSVAEVESVRSALGLGTVTLYGQSWGGMLALLYVLAHPENVDALILSNTTASCPDYLLDISQHRIGLGKEMHAAMLAHEHADTLDDPEYKDALVELYSRHFRRATPYERERSRAEWQEVEQRYFADVGPVYNALWGPHEFKATGPLGAFDVSDRLHEIRVPALVLCGGHDSLTAERCSRPLAEGIADTEFVIFGSSSHLTILEKEADLYLATIRDFLVRRT